VKRDVDAVGVVLASGGAAGTGVGAAAADEGHVVGVALGGDLSVAQGAVRVRLLSGKRSRSLGGAVMRNAKSGRRTLHVLLTGADALRSAGVAGWPSSLRSPWHRPAANPRRRCGL